ARSRPAGAGTVMGSFGCLRRRAAPQARDPVILCGGTALRLTGMAGISPTMTDARVWAKGFAERRRFDVPQAETFADPEHLCLRVRAAGEADRLPRIRRALAAGQGNQPDGRAS